MGLFGFLGRAVTNAARVVGNAVGVVAETVGRGLKSKTIENWGTELRARCHFGATHWNQTSSVRRTVDVHKELEKVKNSVDTQARTIERELIGECIAQVKAVVDSVLPLVPSLDIRQLNDSYAEQITEELSDGIMYYLNPRLSLDDARCLNVLKIESDSLRTEEARRYQDSVMSDAVRSFKRDCVRIKNSYIRQILDLAEAGLAEQETVCRKLEQILRSREEETMNAAEADLARAEILIAVEKLSLLQAVNDQA